MNEQLQEIINDLESLQFDILFWKHKEQDSDKQKMLSDYDNWIDRVIDKVSNLEETILES